RRGRGRAPGHLPPDRADGRRQLHRPHVRRRRARGPRLDSGRLRRRAPDRARAVAHAAGAAVPAAERRRLHHLPARALSPAPGSLRPAAARRLMRRLLPIALVVLVGVALTFTLAERYHHRVLTLVLVWATMGLAWNIISGYAGQTSFGHQAFFGIGAYVTVLLVVTTGLTPWIGMAAGMVAAVVAAVLIGLPTFRLAGIYFALATLAYPLIFRIGMEFLGYQEVPIPMMRDRPATYMQFRDPRAYDLLALAALGGTLLLSHWIEGSRLGYALRALRANEEAAEAAGVDTFRAKMVAYTLSAAPAAVIGAIYAHAILFVVTPDAVFGVLVIVQTLVVCLVGGVGSRAGGRGAALLEVRGVSRAFLGLRALDDVSFSVSTGEILGVIGPNGAGKTTLFNVLNGFLLPDAGQVRYRGTPIHGLRPSAI